MPTQTGLLAGGLPVPGGPVLIGSPSSAQVLGTGVPAPHGVQQGCGAEAAGGGPCHWLGWGLGPLCIHRSSPCPSPLAPASVLGWAEGWFGQLGVFSSFLCVLDQAIPLPPRRLSAYCTVHAVKLQRRHPFQIGPWREQTGPCRPRPARWVQPLLRQPVGAEGWGGEGVGWRPNSSLCSAWGRGWRAAGTDRNWETHLHSWIQAVPTPRMLWLVAED